VRQRREWPGLAGKRCIGSTRGLAILIVSREPEFVDDPVVAADL
jgi:hypothetical protein